MSHWKFASQLSILAIALVFGSYFVHQKFELIREHFALSLWGIIAFTIVNVVFYLLADYLSHRSLDKAYMNLVFINFFVKLFVVLGIPMLYFNFYNPKTGHFVLPFIVIYVFFTIYETYFLNAKAVMRK